MLISLSLAISALGVPAPNADTMAPECAGFLPEGGRGAAEQRTLTAEELARLRDIGQTGTGSAGLSLSPDRTRLAFQVRQADPHTNRFCLGMYVFDLRARGAPKLVDIGGEPIWMTYSRRGLQKFPTGVPQLANPVWSPDGRWIAYLRRDAAIVQVWIARTDGTGSLQVTRSPADVQSVSWSRDGAALEYSAGQVNPATRRAIEMEERSGFLFDNRFMPMASSRPFATTSEATEHWEIDIASGEKKVGSTPDRSATDTAKAAGRGLLTRSARGSEAWAAPRDPERFDSPDVLTVRRANGPIVTCPHPACVGGISGLWWSSDGRQIRFLRYEGPSRSQMGLYAWDLSRRAPHRVLSTGDLLIDCQSSLDRLICARETSTKPRHLVEIDARTGRVEVLFDPNPEFSAIRLGAVERLVWTNEFGLETFGDLVLPPDHRPGQKHPLVVVQYESRGFLRGGTGDEYPIQLLAARGLAVLSFQRPADIASRSSAVNALDYTRIDMKDWSDRRSVLSSLQNGIDAAISKGSVEPSKIGLTGLSDGAATTWFALINSRRFAAAAISTCCEDPSSVMTVPGPLGVDHYRAIGFPPLTRPDRGFWKAYSVALSAGSWSTPLLMQLSDDEYLLSLEAFFALREQSRPVEMYVFPDERHVKWQPAHRLAIYKRNVDWFAFWLLDDSRIDSDSGSEHQRWSEMRNRLSADAPQP